MNMADIPDSDCLACEDVAAGMGVVAMKTKIGECRAA